MIQFPDYYILRDRVPFFLSIIYYLYLKYPYHRKTFESIFYGLLNLTIFITGASITAYLTGNGLSGIFGIRWSYPAPIEWGGYILMAYVVLRNRLSLAESFYLSFITAMGGGWLYEIPRWIFLGNPLAILKINVNKVFFTEFQLLCLPLTYWVINHRTQYTKPRHLTKVYLVYILFSVLTCVLPIPRYVTQSLGDGVWRWMVRIPTQLTLLYSLSGIKGGKE